MISRRALEVATAALTGTFGAAVVVSSIDNGIGWSSAGVDAGTFPFVTGAIILLGSLWNLARGSMQSREVLVSSSDLRRVTALFVPAVVFLIAMATPLALYLVFERMFQVSLPHGALGDVLGF